MGGPDARFFLFGNIDISCPILGKPMKLQNICAEMAGYIDDVRRKRNEVKHPNNVVYASWKTV